MAIRQINNKIISHSTLNNISCLKKLFQFFFQVLLSEAINKSISIIAMDSSDDEFFDAEDNLDFDGANNLTSEYKLANPLNLQDILSTEGSEFELESPKVKSGQNKEVSQLHKSSNIFSKPYSTQSHRENLKNVDIDICFDDIENNMDSILPCGGIKKLLLQGGFGLEPKIGDTVYIHYIIVLEGVDEPIDNSLFRQKALRFQIGSGSVLPVIDTGTRTMFTGETSKFLAKPEFAFGSLGSPPRIPSESRAMVTIRLLKILDEKNLSIREMSRQQRAALTFNELFQAAMECKEEGNKYFAIQRFSKAVRRYQIGASILGDTVPSDNETRNERTELLCILFNNLAQSYILLERYDDAVEACKMAISLPVISTKKNKAYYRYAKALLAKGMPTEAKRIIDRADSLDLSDADVHKLHTDILFEMEKEKISMKEVAQKMFTNINQLCAKSAKLKIQDDELD